MQTDKAHFVVFAPYRAYEPENLEHAFSLIEEGDVKNAARAQYAREGSTAVWDAEGTVIKIKNCGSFVGVFFSSLDRVFDSREAAFEAASNSYQTNGWPYLVLRYELDPTVPSRAIH